MGETVTRGRWTLAPHLALIDEEIRKLVCREVEERVLVVRLPPRHGKSELVSHWTPCWFESNWPEKNILLASYEANYAATWGRKARDGFINVTNLAADVLPGRISPTRQASNDWGTTAGGYMATAGVGGPFTGKGFHLGICDDLIKNAEEAQSETFRDKTWEWLTSTFWSRREPGGVMIVVGTPWHRDDYLARLRRWEEPTREICLPAVCESEEDLLGREIGDALWPARYDEGELEKIRRAQGAYYWNALYQQRPSQHEGAEWPEEYFDDIFVDSWPVDRHITVVALDPSLGKSDKSDYSAFVAVCKGHDGKYYIDANIDRRPSRAVVDHGVEWMRYIRPDAFGCEAIAFQDLLRTMFEDALPRAGLDLSRVFAIHTSESLGKRGRIPPKLTRIRLLTPLLAAKRIKIRRSRGSSLLVEQLRDFPLGDYDDGPDALEMAIRLCEELLQGSGFGEPEPELMLA